MVQLCISIKPDTFYVAAYCKRVNAYFSAVKADCLGVVINDLSHSSLLNIGLVRMAMTINGFLSSHDRH